ncbi:TolC family protein [Armatimonas rosea]|uniref:Outer membrane protein TolC n=1 Tax=Armatimonas rosea TaxID=685828 RepID=A0A7W9STM0_ARMRO|nr:TolC family protein [Armatimonas rosea]MBB6051808.1 outer membrane protein TolC [Armatimonas rosea]
MIAIVIFQEAPIRTVEQAIQIALERSPRLQQARERHQRSRESVEQQRAQLRPQASATASYTRLSTALANSSGGGSGSGSGSGNPFPVGLQGSPPGAGSVQLTRAEPAPTTDSPTTFNLGGGSLNQTSLGLSLTQQLDAWGIQKTLIRMGSTDEAIQQLEEEKVVRELVFTVQSDFYELLRAQEYVRVQSAAIASSTESLRVSQEKERAGSAAGFDVLRAETQLANQQQSLLTAQNQASVARTNLANTLGLPPTAALAPESPGAPPSVPPLERAALLKIALEKRPEARQAQLNQEKANLNLRYAKRGTTPSLSARLSGSYNPSPANAFTPKDAATLSLNLSIPLSDGGTTRSQRTSAHSDLRSAASQRTEYETGIAKEVEQACLSVEDAQGRLQSTAKTVEQAREALRIAQVRLSTGIDTQLSVSDAQATLVQAEVNHINARYDLLIALARLRWAVP